jgi:hypothetical protein
LLLPANLHAARGVHRHTAEADYGVKNDSSSFNFGAYMSF